MSHSRSRTVYRAQVCMVYYRIHTILSDEKPEQMYAVTGDGVGVGNRS